MHTQLPSTNKRTQARTHTPTLIDAALAVFLIRMYDNASYPILLVLQPALLGRKIYLQVQRFKRVHWYPEQAHYTSSPSLTMDA